ncbi:MAG: type II secretory pathway component PulK [Myxococcota bacterium]|jgi:type II secretory pathway component PulK
MSKHWTPASARLRSAAYKRAWRAVRAELRAGPQVESGQPRGVALLLVLMVMAIVAAFTAEYNYKSYIRLHVASNIRDDAIAYYHARSAMEVARLVIKSQNVADNMLNAVAAITGKKPNTELWTMADKFANAFCTGELKLMGKTFFDFTGMGGVGVEKGGMCKARVKPEDGRTNINRVNSRSEKQQLWTEIYMKLLSRREEPLLVGEFDQERAEVALNIIDWADSDTNRTDVTTQGIVQEGAQAEALNMDKGIKVKDAKFDTLAELQYVPDITPDLYCALAEDLTPYATEKLNINQASLTTLRGMLCDPQNMSNFDVACYGPGGGLLGTIPPIDEALYCLDICRTLRQSLMSPGFSNVNQFMTFFQRLRPALDPRPVINTRNLAQALGTKSKIIRVETVGGSYGTYRSLTGIIDTSTGDYVYWREY